MRIKTTKKKWKVGVNNNIFINEICSLKLKNNEQISFYSNSIKERDNEICKKNWGYYLTPSLNRRLFKYKHKVFILKNLNKDYFLVIVKEDKLLKFKEYCANEKLKFFSLKKYYDKL